MYSRILWAIFFLFKVCTVEGGYGGYKDVWLDVDCNEIFKPKNCDFSWIKLPTVKDYERCAPALLTLSARHYILGVSGRGLTYIDNREAFQRIKLKPKMLRDTSNLTLEITTLNQNVAVPIAISPSGIQTMAHSEGELATVKAASELQTIMVLSSLSSTDLEDVAAAANGAHLWIQVYVFKDRGVTAQIIRRAEKRGYRAVVLTVDSNIVPAISCDSKNDPNILNSKAPNIEGVVGDIKVSTITFEDITWLTTVTKLPIIAKGILSGEDAIAAIKAGASAIFVSNHGGRQLDGVEATIDALPGVVKAVNSLHPKRDVYIDGGVRTGFDVYKAIARGAKMVFLGRPILYGLTIGGKDGVKNVLNTVKSEFVDTMILSGVSHPSQITPDTIIPQYPPYSQNKK